MSQIRERLARASLWLASARFLSASLSAIGTVLLARLLAPDDFGLVALAASLIAVASSLTELSLGSALVNAENPGDEHLHTVWTLNLARALLLAGGLSLAAPMLAVTLGDARLELVIYLMSAGLALSGLVNPRISLFERDLSYRQNFLLTSSSTLATFIVSIALAIVFESYWALIVGALAGQTARVAASYAIAPYSPRLGWRRARELWRFSLWLSLGQMVSTLNYRVDQLIVGAHLGRTELGVYAVGGQLAQMPGRELVAPLTIALFPALSGMRDKAERARSGYVRAQTLVTAGALPMTILIALFAQPLVALVLGDKWSAAVIVIQFVAFATAFETLGSLVGSLAMAKGQTKVLFGRDMLKLGLRFPMIVAGLLAGGFLGLLAARALAGLIGTLIDMMLVRSLAQLSLVQQLWANRRCLLATGAMALVSVWLQWLVPEPAETLPRIARLALLGSSAVVAHLTVMLLLWKAEGFPHGPESEVADLARSLLRRKDARV